MKRIIIYLLFIFIAVPHAAFSQKSFDTVAVIKQQAQLMCDAVVKNDFKALATHTYPLVVKSMGGPDKMEATLKQSFAEMQKDGVRFLGASVGQPSKRVIYNKEMQCTVPETIKMKVKGGTLESNSTLVGISTDAKTWYFIDCSSHSLAEMRKMLPNLSSKLVIPAHQQPVFTAD